MGLRPGIAGAIALSVTMLALAAVRAAPVVIGGFEIDANLTRQGASAADWAPGDDGLTGVISQTRNADGTCTTPSGAALLVCDAAKSDPTTYPGGAKESDPAGWLPIQESQVTPKTDITNVYAYGVIDRSQTPSRPVIVNAMERLPKAGDVHLDFEFNRQMNAAGTLPDRQVGDLLIAYDMGGSRNSNNDALKVRLFVANSDVGCSPTPCVGYDYEHPTVEALGASEAVSNGVTAAMNTAPISAGPWKSYDEHYQLTEALPAFSFAEAAIDVTQAAGSQNVCVNFVTVKSRASESVTSQLKDTTGTLPFPFCGGLKVRKYIDTNADGLEAGETYAGEGWEFTVTDATGAVVCKGETDASGYLVCATGSLDDLLPGEYTVTETRKAGWINTDPRADFHTLNLGAGDDKTVVFGNTCYVDKTFEVTGVPSGQSGLFAWWKVTAGPDTGAFAEVPLTVSNGTASGSQNDTFLASNSIDWGFGINRGTSTEERITVQKDESLADGAYPKCALTNSVAFPTATVSGTKYKDVDGNGMQTTVDKPLAGFAFRLLSGTTVVQSTISDADGNYSFLNVTPGTYTVQEVQQAGWEQVEPASPGTRSVTIALGQTLASVDRFGNTPLSDYSVTFTPQTNATEATITCDDGKGSQTGNTYSAPSVRVGTYHCTITIVDP